MEGIRELLRHPEVQRGIRVALAAGLSWQLATLLPSPLSDYAYYAPLGAIVTVHPTVADSASAAWRTVLAVLLGTGLGVTVHGFSPLPTALTLAVLVALAVGLEQWRVLGQNSSWVTFAAVFALTIGGSEPAEYVLSYTGLVLLGGVVGVLVTTLLFPPLQLTQARRQISRTRALLAGHLEGIAEALRDARELDPEQEQRRLDELDQALDSMRDAERIVERARRANPRARRWREPAERIRAESRALDRTAVLVDDVSTLVVEQQPHLHGEENSDPSTAQRIAGALDGLAGVIRTPYHAGDDHGTDERDLRIHTAGDALDSLTDRLRRTTVDDDPAYLTIAAVAVGVQRSLLALDAQREATSST